MPVTDDKTEQFYQDLKALVADGFPKTCGGCGKRYASYEQFIGETVAAGDAALQEQQAEQDGVQVALVRRCSCGGEMVECFGDRRATDELGRKRRELFERLLGLLTDGGMPRLMAKRELLKVMRGEPSTLLTAEQLKSFFSA